MAWGSEVDQLSARLRHSSLLRYRTVLITDRDAPASCPESVELVKVSFSLSGLARKSELLYHLPRGRVTWAFLDTDIEILGDMELGFEKAERHGLAIAPAPHYSLDHFWRFPEVLDREGVPRRSQLQYNTGVFFFAPRRVRSLFRRWFELVRMYNELVDNDQPFLTLAMEQTGFNPYTLSPAYNYRPFMQPISGVVRVWHSREPVPDRLNEFERPWPPRFVKDGRIWDYSEL